MNYGKEKGFFQTEGNMTRYVFLTILIFNLKEKGKNVNYIFYPTLLLFFTSTNKHFRGSHKIWKMA
jgi:hypothetical protein